MATLRLLDLIPPASLRVASDPPPFGPGQAQIIVPKASAEELVERRRARQFRRFGSDDLERAKAIWLRVFRTTGDFKLASAAAGRHPQTIETWTRKDPVFRELREGLTAVWGALLDTDFKSLGVKAVETVRWLLENAEDEGLKAKIAQWILKSQSVGVVRAATLGIEHSGPGGGPIPVRQVVVHLSGSPAPMLEEPGYAREGEGDAGILDAEDYSYVDGDGDEEDER